MKKSTDVNGAPAVEKIEVRDLFGYISYDITAELNRKTRDVLILYGENGSGKTTLLRLLFYMLSPRDRRGHKTVVARTAFSRFSVYFDNGTEVTASRTRGSGTHVGAFDMKVVSPASGKSTEFRFQPDNEGTIKAESDPSRQKEYSAFLSALADIGVALFYLKDDRSMESTLFDERHEPDLFDIELHTPRRPRIDIATITIEAVRTALTRAAHWIRTQAFRAASQGETNTYNIYLDIVRRIAGPTGHRKSEKVRTLNAARRRLSDLGKRAERLASLGLIPEMDTREMARLIASGKSPTSSLVQQVVWPYVDTMTARFDALERIGSALEKFLFYLNKFLRHKQIVFDLREGFLISTVRGQHLEPEMLSSGERHLLLLFCNVLIAEEQPSLFIIDEPELSLNVRWQRLLINALTDCVKENKVSFVIATHSTEMLSQHRQFVQQLKPLADVVVELGSAHEHRRITNS